MDETQPLDIESSDARKDGTPLLIWTVGRAFCGTLPVKEVSKELVGSISIVHPGFPAGVRICDLCGGILFLCDSLMNQNYTAPLHQRCFTRTQAAVNYYIHCSCTIATYFQNEMLILVADFIYNNIQT